MTLWIQFFEIYWPSKSTVAGTKAFDFAPANASVTALLSQRIAWCSAWLDTTSSSKCSLLCSALWYRGQDSGNHILLRSAGFLFGVHEGKGTAGGRRGAFLLPFCLLFLGVTHQWPFSVQPSPCSQNLTAICLRWGWSSQGSLVGQCPRSKRPLLQAPEIPAVAWHHATWRPGSQLYVALTKLLIPVTPTSSLRVEAASCLSLIILVFHFSFLALQHL